MKRRFVNLILILTLLAGLCVFLYPTAADAWNQRTQSRAITGFREALDALPKEDLEPMWEDALDYNRRHRQYPRPQRHRRKKYSAGAGGYSPARLPTWVPDPLWEAHPELPGSR